MKLVDLIFVFKQCVSVIFRLLRFMDLCLDSNSVFGHLLASVIYKNSNQMYRHMVHVAFHISKDCLHFFSLPPPSSLPFLSLIPTFPSPFGFLLVALLFHSAITFLIVFSSSALSFLFLLSALLPVPFISYTTTRLVSLPEYLQFKCHQSCFSPYCLWSSFSLHTDDEASNRKIS